MLQACLNGDRDSDAHAELPTDPASMASAAADAVAAGADNVHLHQKNPLLKVKQKLLLKNLLLS